MVTSLIVSLTTYPLLLSNSSRELNGKKFNKQETKNNFETLACKHEGMLVWVYLGASDNLSQEVVALSLTHPEAAVHHITIIVMVTRQLYL